ncbi:hypothetical protein PsYK624_054000 [Phanerochaete sordida]|uniref:Uncharacterized protein n=1 Tax=Phanerochaete sordida TaxID=48140 RepID=A0A9P3G6Q7_9APHY|nr:hypothetical protein PsYK624_054000 [Phanerochaete sordida]
MDYNGRKLKPLSTKPRTLADWIPAWNLRRETPERRAYRYFVGIDAHLSDDENERCAPDTDEEDAWKETHEPELVAAQEAERKRIEREERHRFRERTLRYEWRAVWSDESDFEEEIRREVTKERMAKEEEERKKAEEEQRRIAEEVARDDAEYLRQQREREGYAVDSNTEMSADDDWFVDSSESEDEDSSPMDKRTPSPIPFIWDEDGGNDADDEALGTLSDFEDKIDPSAYDPIEYCSQSSGIGGPEWAKRYRRRFRAQQKEQVPERQYVSHYADLKLETLSQMERYIAKYSDFGDGDCDKHERSSSSGAEDCDTHNSAAPAQSPKRPREDDEDDAVDSPRSTRRRLTPEGTYDSITHQ